MIKEVKTKTFGKVMYEMFNSTNEVVETGSRRSVTDRSFHDMRDGKLGGERPSWCGVDSFEEAEQLMRDGYQPTVDKMKAGIKANVQGQGKRISFFNDVVGYAPVVPLALQGVPTSMQNSYMKPIKAKVLNIYYDMTASCSTSSKEIIEAGQKLLGAIMELEMQGYKFNLYAIQSYYSSSQGADILCTKIKNSNTPLDLKRMSFALTHTSYFRVIGFDWYSRCPKATYRSGYGHALGYDYDEKQMQEGFREIFGEQSVVFSCNKIIGQDAEHLKEVMTDAGSKKKN